MTFYPADFFGGSGNSECNVESMIMILFPTYLASLSPSSYVSLTRLLWSSLKDTCSINFWEICSVVWPSMFTLRKSLTIGDCTTCVWWIIQSLRDLFLWLLILELTFRFGFNYHGVVPTLISLRFKFSAVTWWIAVFFFTSNILVKRYSYFIALGYLIVGGVMVDLVLL